MSKTTRTRASVCTSDGDTFYATGADSASALRNAFRKAQSADRTVTGGAIGRSSLTGSDVRFIVHPEEYPS